MAICGEHIYLARKKPRFYYAAVPKYEPLPCQKGLPLSRGFVVIAKTIGAYWRRSIHFDSPRCVHLVQRPNTRLPKLTTSLVRMWLKTLWVCKCFSEGFERVCCWETLLRTLQRVSKMLRSLQAKVMGVGSSLDARIEVHWVMVHWSGSPKNEHWHPTFELAITGYQSNRALVSASVKILQVFGWRECAWLIVPNDIFYWFDLDQLSWSIIKQQQKRYLKTVCPLNC